MLALLVLPSATRGPSGRDDLPSREDLLDLTVGGISLYERQTRLLRAAGATSVEVVANGNETTNLPHDEPALLLRADWIVERAAMTRLLAAAPPEGFVAMRAADGPAAGCALAAPGAIDEALTWLDELSAHEGPSPGPPAGPEPAAYVSARAGSVTRRAGTAAALAEVESSLWEGCRKTHDGIVSRLLNRRISLWVSRRLAGTSVTPNMVSLVNLALGLAAAAAALGGDRIGILIGATLLQANSVLDGVDGELARMRIETSVTGEWLDTIVDDLSNQLFFAALAWGVYHRTGQAVWLYLGVVTFVGLTLTSTIYYSWLIRRGRGDVQVFDWFSHEEHLDGPRPAPSLAQRVAQSVARVFRRDAFIFLVWLLALVGAAPYALWIAAPAAAITATSLLARVVTGRLPKAC